MTTDSASPMVPKLRFPSFNEHNPWIVKQLAEISDRVSETVGDTPLTPVSISAGKGFVPQAEKFGRDISGAQYSKYIWLRRGDLAYNRGNSKRFPQGCVYQLTEFDDAAASSAFHCFRLQDDVEPAFILGFFEDNGHGRQLTRHITSGARSNGLLNIGAETFYGIKVPVPPTSEEQQKIADCLGSLDSLIVVESEKLEALRQHKKALFEQLFPELGMTMPIFRFSNFADKAEWEYKFLPDIATNLNNLRVPITAQDRISGDIPYYGATGIIDYVKHHVFDEDLLCVSEDGANLVARTYPISFSISGKTWVNNHAHVLRFKNTATQTIVQAYLNHIDLTDFLTGAAQPKLNRMMLDSIPLALPPTKREQDAVAGCIASLDRMLTVQQKRIKNLSIHKRGLLQQLYPFVGGNKT